MKKIFRFVGFGWLLAAIFAVGAVASFAQDACSDVDGINGLYNDVLTNYKSNDSAVLRKAVDSAKQFLEKYGNCDSAKPQVDWMRPKVPVWEQRANQIDIDNHRNALYKRFDTGFKASNWDEVYASGKDILAGEPNKLDVVLVLGSVGFDQAAKKNNKYNDDTLTYAKLALQKMAAGTTSEKYGLFSYSYGNKENATGWMNLSIGYITYYAKDDKKGALPFIYQASLHGAETTVNPLVYETVGKYFLGETIRLRDDVKVKIQAQDPIKDPDDVKARKEAEVKAAIALLNGNAERALDAYSRAYKVAKTDAANKAYRDSLYQQIQALYNVRFQKTDGIDSYIASATAKPLVDPTTPVMPVEDVEVKTDTTKTSATPTPTPTPAKPAGTKPGQTSGVTKGATAKEMTAKAGSETATSAKPKATVKTTAKKKGLR